MKLMKQAFVCVISTLALSACVKVDIRDELTGGTGGTSDDPNISKAFCAAAKLLRGGDEERMAA